jgi:hypothetical protein
VTVTTDAERDQYAFADLREPRIMTYSGDLDAEQCAILTSIVEAYCKENDIDPASDEGQVVACLVMKLTYRGIATAEELRTVLLGPLAQALAQPSIGIVLQELKAVGRERRG